MDKQAPKQSIREHRAEGRSLVGERHDELNVGIGSLLDDGVERIPGLRVVLPCNHQERRLESMSTLLRLYHSSQPDVSLLLDIAMQARMTVPACLIHTCLINTL